MADRQSIILRGNAQRALAIRLIADAPVNYAVTISEPTRSLDQNAKLWPMLADVSGQVAWYGRKLKPDDWKDIFTASLRKPDVVPGIDPGTVVVLGQRTSRMGKREFADLVELIYAFGAEHDVQWSEPEPAGMVR